MTQSDEVLGRLRSVLRELCDALFEEDDLDPEELELEVVTLLREVLRARGVE